ncbi:MAG TPA: NHL repeat-containing protein, partial [Actinomycetota bacterium]|nr:NHL repeat-containing protein [Actinomycetota bacterium]
PGTVTTVAGGGDGDGYPATTVSVHARDVAEDAVGAVWFTQDSRLRRVSPAGVLSTVAGKAGPGDSGDGGPVAGARFQSLLALALDNVGNLFVADNDARKVRMIRASDGVVTTVAGSGAKVSSGDGGPATQAGFDSIFDVAFEDGFLYIADYVGGVIRRVRPDGIIERVAGTGVHDFSGDGGPAVQAELNHPGGVAVRDGVVFIADTWNDRVRRVDVDGTITTIAGSTRPARALDGYGYGLYAQEGVPATLAHLVYPHGVAIASNGDVIIADTFNHRIRRVDNAGFMWTVAGTPVSWSPHDDGMPARISSVAFTNGLAIGPSQRILYSESDWGRQAIRAIGGDGTVRTIAGNDDVGFGGDGGPATHAMLTDCAGIDVGTDGSIYIADQYGHRIRKVDPSGSISTVTGGRAFVRTSRELWGPNDVAVDAQGNVFIAELYNHRISKLAPDGSLSVVAGGREVDRQLWLGDYGTGFVGDGLPATLASLVFPMGVDVDDAGNLYIADTNNARIRMVDTAGIITTIAGTGTYGYSGDNGPATSATIGRVEDVAYDPVTGSVYFADRYVNRVRRIDASGIVTTVAGNGTSDDSGDGGLATNAGVAYPRGVVPDGRGGFFVATVTFVRHVDAAGIIRTIGGGGSAEIDGVPALQTAFRDLDGLAIDPAGNLLVSATRVRRIEAPLD